MAADEFDESSADFDTRHLPERYHQAVKAKKQRRMKHNLMIVLGLFVVIAVLYLIISVIVTGLFSETQNGTPVPTVTPDPDIPAYPQETDTIPAGPDINVSITFTQGPGLSGSPPAGTISLDDAVAAFRSSYPEQVYRITGADLINSNGRDVYEFTVSVADIAGGPTTVALIDAATGRPYTPGEENAAINRDNAEQQIRGAFPALVADRTLLSYKSVIDNGNQWDFSLYSGQVLLATGTLDAMTGSLRSFEIIVPPDSRPASPSIDLAQAQSIADRYVIDNNGGQLPLNLSISRYDPIVSGSRSVAGKYTFIYERMFQDFLTDVDGFTVIVDGVTGKVTGYTQQWTTPDHAFAAATTPDIIRHEATFAVLQRANEIYPDQIDHIQILSADVRWKNKVPYGTVPRPGTIPLAWKVVFDDAVIRADTSKEPAVAWIDGQSGEFIEFEYRH